MGLALRECRYFGFRFWVSPVALKTRFTEDMNKEGLDVVDEPVIDSQPSLFDDTTTYIVRAHVRKRSR